MNTGSSRFDIKEALNASTAKGTRVEVDIPLDQVMPNRYQPRLFFRNIDELAESIRRQGQLQPIAVRVTEDGNAVADVQLKKYEIIYGGRRFAAFEKLGRGAIKALVYGYGEVSDEQMELWANIENTQREDLKFLEAMRSFCALFEKYGSAKEVSDRTGKTVVTIQYYLNVAKAFDLHDEFKRILKDLLGSSKRADAFTYTVGGRFAVIASHIASLDPDVNVRGSVLKKNKREFKRIIERFDKQGLVESLGWAEDKVKRALDAVQVGGDVGAKGNVGVKPGVNFFREDDKAIRLSINLSKSSKLSVDEASAVKEAIGAFVDRMKGLTVEA